MKKVFLMLALALGAMVLPSACSSKSCDKNCNQECGEQCDTTACTDCSKDNCSDCEKATCDHCTADTATVAEGEYVQKLTDDTLLRPDMKVARLTVIDFNATWCGPCRMLTPSFDAVADALHSEAEFYSVDIDEMKETANAFGIQAIPAVVVLSPDAPARTYVGLDPYLEGVDMDKLESAEALTAIITPRLQKIVTGK